MHDDHDPSPVNPLPPLVLALFFAVMGVEAMFLLGEQGLIGGASALGWRAAVIADYGFNSEVFHWMLQNGRYEMDHLLRFVTYPFVHAGFTHALFGGVMLLAMGKFMSETFSQMTTLIVFGVASLVGAAVFGFLNTSGPWLLGVFPGVYGLIGGFTYTLWVRLGQVGEMQLRAFGLIGVLLGIQLLFGLLFGGSGDWIADLAGFVAGFGVSFVLRPGGIQKIRSWLRSR